MNDNIAPRRARGTRSPEAAERIRRSRALIRDRRDAARKREQAVTAAVTRYITAWQEITNIERARDDRIAALQQQITAAKERAATEKAEHQQRQALAAATIREQGNTDDEVAELLEITPKQARQLIAAANDGAKTGAIVLGSTGGRPKPDNTDQRAEHQPIGGPQPTRSASDDSRKGLHSNETPPPSKSAIPRT
ncbi:hypothetical protein [Nocardia pseudovaccinii]|uniref:hypothetical protein n=1 Tax=Nocardia pseudovaccinii TaxID=189540 RepID=UPI0007A529C9|nr:hypothetical protein [Nocardia pseudovaccinii]